MTPEEKLREKSTNYLPCYVDHCERHATCLHWLVGQHTAVTDISQVSVNPMNPDVREGHCPLYRPNETVRYARGMTHFFDVMPSRMERAIKGTLITVYQRKRFYEYRNGVRPIPPSMQQDIESVCRRHGWDGELHYDSWEENFDW
jgi:hypothetical protein